MTACLVSAQHCGRITCRIEKLRLYDYLWLFAIPGKASHDRCSFTVMPKLPDIDPLAVPTLREDFESSIYAQNRPGRDYSEVYEIRSYREGDPISSIHHKLSAKREELVVREGSYPVGSRLMLLSILPDWTGTIEECEEVLTAVFSVSSFLTADGLDHVIAWLDEDDPSGLMQMSVSDEESFYEAAACVMEQGENPEAVRTEMSQILNLTESSFGDKRGNDPVQVLNSNWYASVTKARYQSKEGSTPELAAVILDAANNGNRSLPPFVISHLQFPVVPAVRLQVCP